MVNQSNQTRGADRLVSTLSEAGIRTIFALSGNQIMPIFDACIDAGIEIIHTRHEAAAVYMADAYAQLTGTVGVALVTAGAGAGNAVGALYTCREADVPVLLLSGDSPLAQDGQGAFQELDQVAMTAPVTKLSFRPRAADSLAADVARALSTAATGRPGPVHLALPVDVLEAQTQADTDQPGDTAPMPGPDPATLSAISDLLAQAERPIVLLGPALNDTRCPGLRDALATGLNLPAIVMESPRGLRDPALGDIAHVLAESDAVLCLGKRVDFTLGFGKPALFGNKPAWVVVNADPVVSQQSTTMLGDRLAATLIADPAAIGWLLIQTANGAPDRGAWRRRAAEAVAARSFTIAEGAGDAAIDSGQLCAAVQRQIDRAPRPILIADGGEFGQWAQAVISAPRRVINGISGAIGGGLNYGLGAKKADPSATVFTLMGDGTIGFHLAEFETAARAGLSFVAVIGNDRRWNAEHQIQLGAYGADRLIGCDLSAARYDLAVAALGGHGEYVTKLGDLDAALARAVASNLVACVNVEINGLPAPGGH